MQHQFQKPAGQKNCDDLIKTAKILMSTLETDEILKRVCSRVLSENQVSKVVLFSNGVGLEMTEGQSQKISLVPSSLFSQVLSSGKTIILNDPLTNPIYNQKLDGVFRNGLLMGVKVEDEVVGVFGVYDKKLGIFGLDDEEIEILTKKRYKDLVELAGIALRNARVYEKSESMAVENQKLLSEAKKEAQKSKILVDVAKITATAASQESLIRDILNAAKEYMNAQACSLFLVDAKKQEMYSSVFADGVERKIRFPITSGVAGSVATTAKPANIPDAYADPRFNPEFDKMNAFHTQSMLCVPIFGPEKEIVGVTTIINKLDPNGKVIAFNDDDLSLYEGISLFCGLAIHKMLLMQDSLNQQQKLAITLELIGFHSSTTPEEIETFLDNEINLYEDESMISWYQYDPHKFLNTDDSLAVISHQMFQMLSYDKTYDIPDYQLVDYLLTVRRSYRPIAYHNFTHAVSVTHGLFVLIINGVLDKYFTKLEMFAMLVACLNHDIDHRGTNNAFQQKTHSVFASFYNTSTMERHHVNHCMTILNSNNGSVNILGNLSKEDYKNALEVIESCILATDLALFFGTKKKITEIMLTEGFDNSIPEHHNLLRGVIMTCSDLCAMYKPFEGARHTANSVYEEFFQQGDQEKALGIPFTSELTDRSKQSEIPRMQVGFYNFVVIPAFDSLYSILGDPVKNLLDACKENKTEWEFLQKSGQPYEYHYDGPVSKFKKPAIPRFIRKVIKEDNASDSDSMGSRQTSRSSSIG